MTNFHRTCFFHNVATPSDFMLLSDPVITFPAMSQVGDSQPVIISVSFNQEEMMDRVFSVVLSIVPSSFGDGVSITQPIANVTITDCE